MNISYIEHKDINISKWDACIQSSFNITVYAFSWYLELFCGDWDALVEDDYLSVMPLIKRRVLGRYIIYTPAFIRELGVFSKQPVHADKTGKFLASIPSQFKHYQIVLNKYNPLGKNYPVYKELAYFELDLISPYYKISRDFSVEIRRKINHAVARQLSFVRGLSPNDLILFVQQHKIRTEKIITDHNFRILRSLMASLIRTGKGELCGVYDEHNELASVALLALVSNRIIMLFHASDPGQSADSPHLYLVDRIIDRYAETNSILSLEHVSDMHYHGLYLDLRAREVRLPEVTSGRLPFCLRLFQSVNNT